jgi:hypothetical protein
LTAISILISIMKILQILTLVSILLFSSVDALAQSKKVQIETLTVRVDSLSRELSNQSAIHNARVTELNEQIKQDNEASTRKISELNTAITSCEKENNSINKKLLRTIDASNEKDNIISEQQSIIQRLEKENEKLKSEIADLNLKINNLKSTRGWEQLLRANENLIEWDSPENREYLGSKFEIFDYVFKYSRSLHSSSCECNSSDIGDDTYAFGWGKNGVFVYFHTTTYLCGEPCYLILKVIDLKTGGTLIDEDVLGLSLSVFKSKMDQIISKYEIITANNCEMLFQFSNTELAEVNNTKVRLITDNSTSRIIQETPEGREVLLFNFKHEYPMEDYCRDRFELYGYFYNPLNNKQVILQLFRMNKCGMHADDETYYEGIFLPVNLN